MGSRSCILRSLTVLKQHFQGLQMVFFFTPSEKTFARSSDLCIVQVEYYLPTSFPVRKLNSPDSVRFAEDELKRGNIRHQCCPGKLSR